MQGSITDFIQTEDKEAELSLLRDFVRARMIYKIPDYVKEGSPIYISKYHMFDTAQKVREIGTILHLPAAVITTTEITALVHDIGCYDVNVFLCDRPQEVQFSTIEDHEERTVEVIEGFLRSETVAINVGRSTVKNLIRNSKYVIKEAADTLSNLMFIEDTASITEDIRPRVLLAIADGLQVAHPAHIYYLRHLIEQNPSKYPLSLSDLIAQASVSRNVYKAVVTLDSSLKTELDCVETLENNIKIRESISSALEKIDTDDEEARTTLVKRVLSLYESLCPELVSLPTFSEKVPSDLPKLVLAKLPAIL